MLLHQGLITIDNRDYYLICVIGIELLLDDDRAASDAALGVNSITAALVIESAATTFGFHAFGRKDPLIQRHRWVSATRKYCQRRCP